jgi:hypothetical protein
MFQGAKFKISLVFGAAVLFLLLFSSVGTGLAQDIPVGKVMGFIYAQDGTTPLGGAVVKFKNISTGDFYESGKSDHKGYFKIQDIPKGVYLYGVITADGFYNSDGLVGLNFKGDETAKLSIAVSPYSQEATQTMQEFYNDLDVNGESYVGRVAEFDAAKMTALVKVERGMIQVHDKIHDKGLRRDFTQSVKQLESEGVKVKRAYAGQTASIKMKKKADVDDMVFVIKKKMFLPWLWTPMGAAALIAFSGTAGYVTRVLLEEECEPCSPDRNKRK